MATSAIRWLGASRSSCPTGTRWSTATWPACSRRPRWFSASGSAARPIGGTAFLRAGGALNDVAAPSAEQVIAALRAAIEGIKQRGSADLGDKTLLDALVPAVDELEAGLSAGAGPTLERAAATARTSAEATKGMLAQRGNASYTGERSRDSADAGAIGIAVIFEAVSKAVPTAGLETAQ